ncbi:hypothetical protein BGX27_011101 [Mortierella sp. AM989]|nr:hypothetical protein BGX27_011101 [Mortierella sp. AM989]
MGFSYRTFLTLSIALSYLSPICAQQQPTVTGASAFARVGNYFFIHSGTVLQDHLVNQFYALDLTTSWSTSQPAWKSLPPGPHNAYHTAGSSSDNATFYTFGRNTGAASNVLPPFWLSIYNIKDQTWQSLNPPAITDTARRDFYATTNPTLNQVYVFGGNTGVAGDKLTNFFNTLDVNTGTMTETVMPAQGPQNAYTYASVWVAHAQKMLVIGGQTGGSFPVNLAVFTPGSGVWSTQNIALRGKQYVPLSTSFLRSHEIHNPRNALTNPPSNCSRLVLLPLLLDADGTLVAVFGGFIAGGPSADPNAYILDTRTWIWTQIPYGGTGRGNTACAIVDDIFMVWGGFFNNPGASNGLPTQSDAMILLNLSTKQWVNTYTPSPALAAAKDNTNGGGDNSDPNIGPDGTEKSGISTAAIGGIAAGAIVVLLAAAFFVHRRNKKRTGHFKPDNTNIDFTKADEDYDAAAMHQSGGGRPTRPPPPPEIFSPSHYDFESSPSISNIERNSQQLHMPISDSHQNFSQHPYQQSQISPNMIGVQTTPSVGYSSGVGYPGYSPSSTAPLVAISEYDGASPYQQQMQRASYVSTANVYYPPPPTVSNQQQGYIPYNARDSVNIDSIYKVPIPEEPAQNTDSYHDGYGQQRMSIMSDTSTGKRPVSGPQGGYGHGTTMADSANPVHPGSPQTIAE